MSDIAFAYLLSLMGFAACALAMPRHQPHLAGQAVPAPLPRIAQMAGTALLAGAIAVCIARWQASIGIATWLGVGSFAALSLASMFTYCARRVTLRLLAAIACAAATLFAARHF